MAPGHAFGNETCVIAHVEPKNNHERSGDENEDDCLKP